MKAASDENAWLRHIEYIGHINQVKHHFSSISSDLYLQIQLQCRYFRNTPTLGLPFGVGTVLVLSTEGCYRTAKSQRKQRKHVLVLFGTFF